MAKKRSKAVKEQSTTPKIAKVAKSVAKLDSGNNPVASEVIDPYWICRPCAELKGWTAPKWPVTCTQGRCAYCEGELTWLTPIVDFGRPGKPAMWD